MNKFVINKLHLAALLVAACLGSKSQAACTYGIAPAYQYYGCAADAGAVAVSTTSGCAWGLTNTNAWITITSATNGTDSGIVSFTVAVNTSLVGRTGYVNVAGQILTVGQQAGIMLAKSGREHGYGAATNSVSVTASNDVVWHVVNTNNWITITSGNTGTGTGLVNYTLELNEYPVTRLGEVLIGGQTFTVTQQLVTCSYKLSTTNRPHGFAAVSNYVGVTAYAGCAWAVTNTNTWITIVSPLSGMGNGTVSYQLPANPTAVPRSGVVRIDGQSLFVSQEGAPCSFALIPATRSHGLGVETGLVSVAVVTGCSLTVSNPNPWITITSVVDGGSGGTVGYMVATNSTGAARSGVITIGDALFTVIQAGVNCAFGISPASEFHYAGIETGMVSVTTSAGCGWNVSNTNAWISIAAGSSGSGSGTVGYALATNSAGVGRTGLLTIAGQTFTMIQQGPVKISPIFRPHGYSVASNYVTVTAADGCAYGVINTNPWISVLTGTNGNGPGTVNYTVQANPDPTDRTGVVLIGGLAFTVTQTNLPCTVSLSPSTKPHGYGASGGTILVTNLAPTCPWAVVNTNAWVTIISGTNGVGNGSLTYTVDANPSNLPRTGWVAIGGATLTINQSGAPCDFAFSPSSAIHGFGTETGMVNVIAVEGCTWGVTNTNTWITITSGSNGTGSGVVVFVVLTNASLTSRTGALRLGTEVFTVTQDGAGSCNYRLSPTSRPHGYGAASNFVSLSTGSACAWLVENTNDWITITSGTNGAGSTDVTYAVDANPYPNSRTAVVLIGGAAFTVTQSNLPCTVSLSPSTKPHGYGTSGGTILVTNLSPSCPWTVVNTNAWVTIISGTNGVGNGSLTYTVDANPYPSSRTAVVLVGNAALTLNQAAAPCTVSVSPANRPHGHGATTGFVTVDTGTGCPWTVVNTNTWITITSGTNGVGITNVTYALEANPSALQRVGLIQINNDSFTITQAGVPCSYVLSPASTNHGFGIETGLVSVVALDGCPWAVINTNAWITITSLTNGAGAGTVVYVVATNTSPESRTAVVIIDSQFFTLTQDGAGSCNYRLSTTNRPHGYGATTNSVSVTVGAACSWSVVNTNAWLAILPASSNGIGSGTVYYTVEANPDFSGRTGVVQIADQFLWVSQDPLVCTYKISASSRNHGFAQTTNQVGVTASSACGWSVVNTNGWITIASGGSGMGTGAVTYVVAPNFGSLTRTGNLVIADRALAISQKAAGTNFTLERITLQPGGQLVLRLAGGPQGTWELQQSSNMVNWATFASVTNLTGVVEFNGTVATNISPSFLRAFHPEFPTEP